MRALVTGGAGFIGSHLVDALAARGDDVVALDALTTGVPTNVPDGVELVVGDVVDEDLVAGLLQGCDVVFHEAGHRSVPQSLERPVETDRVNTGGTLAVLAAARRSGTRRVVLASSSSVYGGAEQLPTPESAPVHPRSPYAVSKLNGEHYARVFAELYGLETVCLRYFNVFGPRQDPRSAYAAVIPLFADAVATGEVAVVHGDGQQSRDFTFVDDAVAANLCAAAAPAEVCDGRPYNVARGERHTLLELLEVLGRELGRQPVVKHVEPRAGDIKHSQADITAARTLLGYTPSVPFADGLGRMLAWLADQQPVGDAAR